MRKQLIFSLLTTITFFCALEVSALLWERFQPPHMVDYGLGFAEDSKVFEPVDVDLRYVTTRPEKAQAFRVQTFLAEKPDQTLRIVMLGGSSVNYLEEHFKKLQTNVALHSTPRFTDVEIVNVGGLSYGTHRLVPVLVEVLTYRPNIVVIYTGHNEFEEFEQLQLAQLHRLIVGRTLAKSALVRFVRDRLTNYQVSRLLQNRHDQIHVDPDVDYARAWTYPFTDDDVKQRMRAYRENVETIVSLCRSQDVGVIVCTVPSNLVTPYLPESDWQRYNQVSELLHAQRFSAAAELGRTILQESAGRHQSSEIENGIIKDIAKTRGVVLADIEAAVVAHEPHHVPGERLFIDHCHLNANGQDIWIETLQPLITQMVRQKD